MAVMAGLFLGIAVYGAFIGKFGAAALGLLMAGFTCFGARMLARRDYEFDQSPAGAKHETDTLAELETQCSESGRSEF